MSSTSFSTGIVIPADWLNDVNGLVWTVFNGATTPALARTALGLTASSGSSLIGYLTSGTGATATTVQTKLREQLSVKDFGAVGDGATDDSAAFQAAITAAAVIGTSVFVPSTASGYYMGTTGLTLTSYVALVGSHKSSLKWSSSFTGTAITLSGSYNRLENLILFKPTQSGAVNSGIIAVDSQGALNVFEDLEIRVSGALANNGWYTGIKVQGLETTIRRCAVYAYDIGVLYSHAGSNSDLSIDDSIVVAQVTASIKTINASSISIVNCDIEGGSTPALHGIWINTSTVVSAGINISGNIIVNFATDGIFLDANASFPIQGVSITGNQVYGVTTSAVSMSNTVGVSLTGNYLSGGTNYLLLANSNTLYDIGQNFTSGVLAQSGTTTGRTYSTGTWVPTVGGNSTYTSAAGTYTKIGQLVTLTGTMAINALGTGSATTISVGSLPYTPISGSFPGVVDVYASLATNAIWLAASLSTAGITFNLSAASSASSTNGAAIFGNSASVRFTISYLTASA